MGLKQRAVGQALQGEEMTRSRSTELGQSGCRLGQQGGHTLGAGPPWGASVRASPWALRGLSSWGVLPPLGVPG